MNVLIRPATHEDAAFLRRMFAQAVLWRDESPGVAVLERSELAHYFREWGRPGDHALIAEEKGAAWFRLFPSDEPGYGFVSKDIPELGIAVARESRGRGVGRMLLRALQAAAIERGYSALSLSVHPNNPAIELYRSAGFERIDGDSSAVTMLWRAPGTL